MKHALEADDIPVRYQSRFRAWVIEQQDGIGTGWQIRYCPWCGQDLGEDLGGQWIYEVERRGLDPTAPDDDLPSDLRDDRWWRALRL
jgi:hypothetical protein